VFNVIPCASDHETAVTAVSEVRHLLTSMAAPPGRGAATARE
jgi:hypothetical protein